MKTPVAWRMAGRIAGRASGEARRERIRQRDLALAVAHTELPGKNSFAELARQHGLNRSTVMRAIARASADPANRKALDDLRLLREADLIAMGVQIGR